MFNFYRIPIRGMSEGKFTAKALDLPSFDTQAGLLSHRKTKQYCLEHSDRFGHSMRIA